MAEHTTDDERELDAVDDERPLPAVRDGPPPTVGDEPPRLAAEVVLSRDRRAECTIYPFDAPDADLVTQWVTAAEGSFVGLDEMR